ncbi:RsmB/NOP family class I SAM-dependent RNA methyltransferase [Pararhodobacter oceanensis]|uniref:RsmB/NOP family class I SAM-dependent RNA methyltransferase n=1 Tax=Pararhodobacter oceanensis TaxID=2172121 RepID=UPI003A8F8F0C
MTPAARQAAAIDLLDQWRAGRPLEAALTTWARKSRYAGSKDREAVRDIVFQAVRCARSAAALGGGEGGRAMLLGLARAEGEAPQGWTGETYTPVPLTADEAALFEAPPEPLPRDVALDCPAWLWPQLERDLGADAGATLDLMRDRAPVYLRVNIQKISPEGVIARLAQEEITAIPHPLAETALLITRNPRRLRNSSAFKEGLVELQDLASQAVALDFSRAIPADAPVLDYCAGGGGKSLALAALGHRVSAHDVSPSRMRDIAPRAARAGVQIAELAAPGGDCAAVFADAPCSGSGSWRRAPEAKWSFSPDRLDELTTIQDSILANCAALTAADGVLGYATCSLLRAENEDRIAAFLATHRGWACLSQRRIGPLDGGDGFFLAILQRG